MSSQNKYNIPKTKQQKVALIKSIMNGEKTIDHLKDFNIKVSMWMQDESNPEYLKSFDGLERISKAEHESKNLSGNIILLTLELTDKDIVEKGAPNIINSLNSFPQTISRF